MGGLNVHEFYSDVYTCDISSSSGGAKWKRIEGCGGAEIVAGKRSGHGHVTTARSVYIFGGMDDGGQPLQV